MTTDEWPSYSYFLNANEWHYNLTYESTVAMAVKDYARKSGMENEGWRLKRIYEVEGIWYGFVESEKGSELYLLIHDYPDNSYIVAADVRKNKRAEQSLGESYSYNSALKWYPYDIYKKYDVSTSVSEVNNGYDSIYANCGYTALLAYLALKGIKESSWELDGNYMYIGSSGYIAYICFTNDEQRVDLLIDVSNKTFTVLKEIDK